MNHRLSFLARMFLVLAGMVISLAACQGAAVPPPDRAGEPAPVRSTTISTASTAAPVPTATQAPSPTATLRMSIDTPVIWYLRGTAPADLPRVNERLNQALAARGFRAQLEIHIIAPDAFEQQMEGVHAAGQPWDLVSLSENSYPVWLEKGRLLPLTAYANPVTGRPDNLFETQLPGLRAGLPDEALAGLLRSNGNLSAIPNQGTWARPRGFSIRADVVRALELQANLDRVHHFAGLTPLLAKLQAAIENGTLANGSIANGDKIRRAAGLANLLRPENAGYDVLWGPFVVRFDDDGGAVQNWSETPAFRELAGLRRDWQQAGYLPPEPLTPEQIYEGYRSGQYVAAVGQPVYPGSALDQAARYGYEWIDVPLAPPFLSTGAVLSSLTGANARLSGDPERLRRVMLFLEWLHTDPELYNLLAYGIEGQHWQWHDQEKGVINLAPGSRYRPDFVPQLGNQTLSYSASPQPPGLWQAVGQANLRASASTALGFRFDSRPVAAQAAAIRGLVPELEDPLANGQVEDIEKAVRSLQKTLEAAGLAAVQEELERQFIAWKP